MGNTLKFLLDYKDYVGNDYDPAMDGHIYDEILKRTVFGSLSIVEGLIHSCETGKAMSIIKRRFPGVAVTPGPDGEIFISGLTDQLSNILPIITNLGYFISKVTIDGEEWVKDFSQDDCPVALCIESKYDMEVSIPEVMYHASPLRHKQKIMKSGLSPRTGNKLSRHPERIYLTDDANKAIMFGKYLMGTEGGHSEWYQNGFCVYEISGEGVGKLYSDVNLREGGFYTMWNISPRHIKMVKEFDF